MLKTGINQLLIGIFCVIMASCNTYKGAKKMLLEGNYDQVITLMTNKYKKGVNDKNKKKLVPLLHEAYIKANAQDLENIHRFKLSADPEKDKSIYMAYHSIQLRQDRIKPFLPIELYNRNVEFPITDYSAEVETYKESYAKLLYNKSIRLLDNPIKSNAQEAFGYLKDLEGLYPNYINLKTLLIEAYRAGTTFIYVEVRNNSEYLMPKIVDENLKHLDTRYLNENWHEFHTILQNGVNYDFDILFDIQDIDVSAERISRNRFVAEKEIVDGWEYEKDESGEFVLDSLDNKIKVDIIKTVRAKVTEKFYHKSAYMKTKVAVINNQINRIESTRFFESELIFSEQYCIVSGEEMALEEAYRSSMNTNRIYFPSDTDMLQDCATDVKQQVRTYLKKQF